MTDLLLVFFGGALGSSHCLGMCGGFALTIGVNATSWRANLARQLVYSVGRVFTYSAAGAMASYGALRLGDKLPSTVPTQAILSLAAGLFLLWEGLRAAGILARRTLPTRSACLGPRFFGPLLTARGCREAFLAGVFTGFLPCGLVYAFLAFAATTPHVWEGAARMAAFGLGTIPLMVIVGVGGAALGVASRRYWLRLAGWCVILSGVVSITRGVGFLVALRGATNAGCPFCQ